MSVQGALIFDIDGTLTDTTAVDDAQWWAAVGSVLPLTEADRSREFDEYTDSAMLRALCDLVEGRDYEAARPLVLAHFLEGLRSALATDPAAFEAVPGSREVFSEVTRAGWAPGIATGGWRESAVLKLAHAEIPFADVPLATSSELPRRPDIIRLAAEQSGSAGGPVVYVGDGVWDVRACRELGIGFIGRARTPHSAERLRRHGATAVIDDFTAPDRLFELLSAPERLIPRVR